MKTAQQKLKELEPKEKPKTKTVFYKSALHYTNVRIELLESASKIHKLKIKRLKEYRTFLKRQLTKRKKK